MKTEANKEDGAGGLKRTTLRDNLESIAIAVLLVLLMRQMVVEAFKIPTGSMAPALVGVHKEVRCTNCGAAFSVGNDKIGLRGEVQCHNCFYQWRGAGDQVFFQHRSESLIFQRPEWLWHRARTEASGRIVSGIDAANRLDRWGSRIFVNKFIYRLRDPRRWELAVFEFPYGDKNYIKRIIGLPGETVSIRNGNIYINGEIARKPPAIQQHIWMPVLDTELIPSREVVPMWDFAEHSDRWESVAGSGALTVDAGGIDHPIYARYAAPIRDFYAYNAVGNIEGRSNRHRVDEVKIETLVRIDDGGDDAAALSIRAAGGAHDFNVRIPVNGEKDVALYDRGEKVMLSRGPHLQQGGEYRIAVERYDKTLAVHIDGEEILRYLHGESLVHDDNEQFVGLGAVGLEATFERVRLFRDIYYLPGMNNSDEKEYVLDDESYFVLGDNSPYSSDSREWESHEVPSQNLIGRAFAIFWPVSDIMFLPAGEAK